MQCKVYFRLLFIIFAVLTIFLPTNVSAEPRFIGVEIDPEKPLRLQFFINNDGRKEVTDEQLMRLVNYFLAGLTIPKEQLWVNLSPYEANRVIPDNLPATEIGRDLLIQDLTLKTLSSVLTDPETTAGKAYWGLDANNVTKSTIPASFNKVWITPDHASVYTDRSNNRAVITEATLAVIIDKDYIAMHKNQASVTESVDEQRFRRYIIPILEKKLASGEDFVTLRQIYSSLILAQWFKQHFSHSFYRYVINKGYVSGISVADKTIKDNVYTRYCRSFKQGEYDYKIKRKIPGQNKYIQRRYFSGGINNSSLIINDCHNPSQAKRVIAQTDTTATFEIELPEAPVKIDIWQDLSRLKTGIDEIFTNMNVTNIPDSMPILERLQSEPAGREKKITINTNDGRLDLILRRIDNGLIIYKPKIPQSKQYLITAAGVQTITTDDINRESLNRLAVIPDAVLQDAILKVFVNTPDTLYRFTNAWDRLGANADLEHLIDLLDDSIDQSRNIYDESKNAIATVLSFIPAQDIAPAVVERIVKVLTQRLNSLPIAETWPHNRIRALGRFAPSAVSILNKPAIDAAVDLLTPLLDSTYGFDAAVALGNFGQSAENAYPTLRRVALERPYSYPSSGGNYDRVAQSTIALAKIGVSLNEIKNIITMQAFYKISRRLDGIRHLSMYEWYAQALLEAGKNNLADLRQLCDEWLASPYSEEARIAVQMLGGWPKPDLYALAILEQFSKNHADVYGLSEALHHLRTISKQTITQSPDGGVDLKAITIDDNCANVFSGFILNDPQSFKDFKAKLVN